MALLASEFGRAFPVAHRSETFIVVRENSPLEVPTDSIRYRLSWSYAGGRLLLLTIGSASLLAQQQLGSVKIGETTPTVVTVTIEKTGAIGKVSVLTQGSPGLEFKLESRGTCEAGKIYAGATTCTVNVSFKPRFAGTVYGAVVLTDSTPQQNVMATAYLQGNGDGPQIAFSPGEETGLEDDYLYVVGVTFDGAGNLYVADAGDLLWYGTISGSVYREMFSDGKHLRTTVGSEFRVPWGVAVDGAGNVYISDAWNFTVYKETLRPDGTYFQSTIYSGFETPVGVAVDGAGNAYVADFGGMNKYGTVYKETLSNGQYTQSKVGAGWIRPYGVAVDGDGNVYVADFGPGSKRGQVYKLTPHGGGYSRSDLGTGWWTPNAVAVDGTGNVYVGDVGQFAVLKEAPLNGGGYSQSVIRQATGSGSSWPHGVAVDGARNVYIADSFDDALVKYSSTIPPSLRFANTTRDTTSEDSPKKVTLANVGNEPLKFLELEYPANFPEDSSDADDCTLRIALAAYADCTVTIDFSPRMSLGTASSATLDNAVTLTTDSLNGAAAERKVPVTGVEVKSFPPAETPRFTVAKGTYSSPQRVKISDATRGATIFFTLDGSTPTIKSTQFYSFETLVLSTTTTIRAIAVASQYSESAVASATYTID